MWPSVEVGEEGRAGGADGSGSVTKVLSSALAWPRVGGAGRAELAQGVGGSHAVLRDCARGSFGALSALDLRARFAPLFHRLELNCSEHSWLC